MEVFIDRDAVMPIDIRFIPFYDENGRFFAAEVLDDGIATKFDNELIFHCEVKGKDFDSYSNILEQATIINHITGKPMIRTKIYKQQVFKNYFIKWTVIKDGESIPLMNDINSIEDGLITEAVKKWQILTHTKVNITE